MYTGIIVLILLVVIWLGCVPKSASFTPGSLNQMRLNAKNAIKKTLGLENYDQGVLWSGNSAGGEKFDQGVLWSGNTAGMKKDHFDTGVLWAGNAGHIAGRENYNTKLAHDVQRGEANAGWPPSPNVPSGMSVGKNAGIGQGTLYAGIM